MRTHITRSFVVLTSHNPEQRIIAGKWATGGWAHGNGEAEPFDSAEQRFTASGHPYRIQGQQLWLPLSWIPEHASMARNDPIGDGQDFLSTGFEFDLVPGERVGLRGHIFQPPEVGKNIGAVIGPHDERGIFFGVAGRAQHGNAGDNVEFLCVITPEIPSITRPEIHNLGVREQGNVYCMVGMMVTDKDVGHIFGRNPPLWRALPKLRLYP
jgi:hypothetical protein